MNIVILAAGRGKRMRSPLPKVLHSLAGKPLLAHVIDTARTLSPTRLVVVVGHGGDKVRETVGAPDVQFAVQDRQLGTGHAVQQALPLLDPSVPTLVLYGDVPLTRASTLKRLIDAAGADRYGVLTVTVGDQTGYGRIVRDASGKVKKIVEQKDANEQERRIAEINTGIVLTPTRTLEAWLASLKNDNAQGEFYLTDIVERTIETGVEVVTVQPDAEWETLGVNSKVQLAELERIHQRNVANALLDAGVTLMDPARIDVRGTLECGTDVSIDVNCVFEGHVTLGDNVTIGPNCVIRDAVIGAGSRVETYTHIEGGKTGANVVLGPYARLRPGATLGDEAHIGNFVEVKNAVLGHGSKANHLTYIGDSDIGARVNVGAGTITCNYDGANKHRTVIEDDVFIGSDTQLVAPVRVGRGVTIAAGTTVWKDVGAGELVLNEKVQVSKAGYARPVKKKS
ncbi:N-acetylglucosamine-1-phosphateuridyltransferase / Glucosamine-1-phosphateN-acetyltransferase [Candidatus Paraburkholderia kirkii UZHbot1]|uniref:Bifunctional protein GlmU n=1 Tax=Candidatus Paraburkholderia kirkii UZHbot1 TaxID=1055526 RepID=G4M6Q6_9BURK|nr:N-acetylglucosamine-1-phosphateuridyltransferase / Glucosamine-1-phosphateN-acetyltransferase [Candidatus Paraburkholderia kirkii UZHbot1]